MLCSACLLVVEMTRTDPPLGVDCSATKSCDSKLIDRLAARGRGNATLI
jgi:hypothetical protein